MALYTQSEDGVCPCTRMHTCVTAHAKPKGKVKAGLLEGVCSGCCNWSVLTGGNVLMYFGEVSINEGIHFKTTYPSDLNPLANRLS